MASVQEVTSVVYPKPDQDCPYAAVGVSVVKMDKEKLNPDEKCVFSQELLRDCDTLAALVFSDTKQKGAQLEWKFMCNHLFDLDYLARWVEFKGAEYLHCPLCKEGISEHKENIEEHRIESLEQLKEHRDQHKQEGDEYMQYHVEGLILTSVCEQALDPELHGARIRANLKLLKEVFDNWKKNNKIAEFRPRIKEGIHVAIKNDNAAVLQIVLKRSEYVTQDGTKILEDRKEDLTEFLTAACKANSFACATSMLKLEGIQFNTHPKCLLEAVRVQNPDLIEQIMQKMIKSKKQFVCDVVFQELIRQDMEAVARQVCENRWHKITDEDNALAQKLDGLVWKWLHSRMNPSQALTRADSNVLEWGDDGDWGGEEDEDDDEWGEDEEEG